MMARSLVVAGLLSAAVSPAWGQTPPPSSDDPAKPQVQTFEMVLRSAVERGGQNFARRASELVPVVVSPGESPVVSGVAVRELSLYVFEVQVPGLWQTSVMLSRMMNRGAPGTPAMPNPARQVSSAGTVEADPMTASPAVSTFDPNREYTLEVRDALVGAVLDSWAVLPLAASDSLVIIAGSEESITPNPLYREPSRKLVLSVKASDLTEYKEGRISREEIRRRIRESHF